MSTSFEARFSTTRLSLSDLLTRVEAALPDCGLRFFGAITRLESDNGWPTVAGLDFAAVDSLADAAKAAATWWGLGIECVSDVLLAGMGRSDAVEVYLNVFRDPEGRLTMSYLESGAATDHRVASEDAAKSLVAIQIALCDAGHFELSIYDEQDHERDPVPTLRNAEVAIRRAASDLSAGDLSVVVSSSAVDHARARHLAGPRAAEVKLSANGYTVFPFLSRAGA